MGMSIFGQCIQSRSNQLITITWGHTGLLGIVTKPCEEMKLCKILDLNVKLKNDENKFSPIMTVK